MAILLAERGRAIGARAAETETVDGVVEEYLMAARKSVGDEAAAAFGENCRRMYPQMARIAITPSWVRFYDFGTGGCRGSSRT